MKILKTKSLWIYILWVGASFLFLSCINNSKTKLNIATAANMQYAMAELVDDFYKISGIKCNVILGSSGKLLAQIVEGAPYDVFVSADNKYPLELYRQGLTVDEPMVYANGQLVLITGDSIWSNFSEVNFSNVKKFAVANPKTAPYGKAAEEAIGFFGWDVALHNKKVYGESISQTNLFITTGSADMGLTSQSIVYSGKLDSTLNYMILPVAAYSRLEQAAVLLRSSKNKQAIEFFNYLLSKEARTVLKKFGYLVSKS